MWLSLLATLVVIFIFVTILVWFNADHPKDGAEVKVYFRSDAPILQRRQKLKVMTYNVQFLAGKSYVFFFDAPDYSGPDGYVDMKDILATADGLSKMIVDEAPDIILFQELDDGSRRTNYQDQLALLLERLPDEYCCYASAFYWKLKFAPHPKLLGPMGMKTAILSKYKITKAERHNLPVLPINFFLRQFSGQKLILQTLLPVDDGSQVAVMSVHLDAFTVGSDVMTRQLGKLREHITRLEGQNIPWVLGGDFNLLPPGQYEQLIESHRTYYNPDNELASFYQDYKIVPSLANVSGTDAAKWYTFSGNDPALSGLDRTLDYIVYSDKLNLLESRVRQSDTQKLSDHLPVIAIFEV